MRLGLGRSALLTTLVLGSTAAVHGQDTSSQLAREDQNPLSPAYRISFGGSVDFGSGEGYTTAYGASVGVGAPLRVGQSLLLLPSFSTPYDDSVITPKKRLDGLGDSNFTLIFTSQHQGSTTFGIGPTLVLPTARTGLGSPKWSAGPEATLYHSGSAFGFGLSVNNVWSFAGDAAAPPVNRLFASCFVNWNTGDGWFLHVSPSTSANWEIQKDRWGADVGGGVGHTLALGPNALTVDLGLSRQVAHPGRIPWSMGLTFRFLFPTQG